MDKDFNATPPNTMPGLSLAEALAAAPYVQGEPSRIAVRDFLLAGLSRTLPAGQTPAHQARQLASDLAQPDRPGRYSEILATVRRLSRAQRAPTAVHIERVLRRLANAEATKLKPFVRAHKSQLFCAQPVRS